MADNTELKNRFEQISKQAQYTHIDTHTKVSVSFVLIFREFFFG